MGINKLDSFFNPKRIALIGVTINPNSVGGKTLTNLVGSGFKGVVYPVNPTSEAVLGIQCYPNLKSLPKNADLAVICTAAEKVPETVKECGESGINNIIIMSAGFKEIGGQGIELEKKILDYKKSFENMKILGPNCLGLIVPSMNLNVSFASGMPKPGNIAFISQSGALCTSILDWAMEKNIGFSYFLSIGNALDVDFADLIDFLGEDEKTKSIILYIESISDARKFITAARSFARSKPIVAYKAGRYPESAEVAASHTGALASEDSIYDAAFKRTGITRVYDIGEIFAVTELIGKNKMPDGSNLGIVTNAGGPAVMATDTLFKENGNLAKLEESTMSELKKTLPPTASVKNPVDVLGDATTKRVTKAADILLKDKNVDALLVIITPQSMTNPAAIARGICSLNETTKKPVLAAFLGGEKMREGLKLMSDSGIAAYSTPEQAVTAFMILVDYSRNLMSLYETPKDIPVEFTLDRDKIRKEFNSLIKGSGSLLSEELSKKILKSYGIPVTLPEIANNEDEALKIARRISYPVVLKIHSNDITHKTDVGGVALNVGDDNAVRNSYRNILKNVKNKNPKAIIEGVTVQKMITEKNSVEMILGIKKDAIFGTTIMVGMGGIYAELFKDRALGFPPLNETLTSSMLESLKIFPLLNGYRGMKPVNINKLTEVLMRISYLAADFPEIKELDVNPLLVFETGVMAVDARIIIDREISGKILKPYSHLALHPYPEEYIKKITLKDGTKVLLRPIKPEDEPLWFDLLASCSKESIYSRFRYFFQWQTHEAAIRYCYIDYDREIAIVAEVAEKGRKKLIGVGRLISEPDLESVEYAILISDKYQNKDLGGIITDYCFEIAKKWGMKKIVAQTTTDNTRMISVFRKRGFEIYPDISSSLVDVSKTLA
jgi:acetyltransferase